MKFKNVDNTEQHIISLCTGIRGLERGIERALGSIRVLTYVEIESFIVANLIAGMEAGVLAPAPVWTNLKDFPSGYFHRKVHGIIGGYPCQPFSVAGNQKGVEDPRHLWPYIAKHIRAIEPVWCLFENVPGHLNIGFREVKSELEEMGYRVEAGIYSAQEVGAPHKRDRLFILAIRVGVLLEHTNYSGSGTSECRINRNREKENEGWKEQSLNRISGSSEESEESELGHTESSNQQRNIIEAGHEEIQIRRSGSSEELADSRLLGQEINEIKTTGVEQYGEELANPHSYDTRTGFRYFRGKKDQSKGEKQRGEWHKKEWKWLRNEFRSCSESVADSDSSRSEQNRQQSELRTDSTIKSPSNSGITNERENDQRRFDKWPARPGQPQYDWEEPRTSGYINRLPKTIRSLWSASRKNFAKMLGEKIWEETDFRIQAEFELQLGTTIAGYQFREDLLRAAGNAVVEQTAELAFIDLLRKHKEDKMQKRDKQQSMFAQQT